MHQSIDKKNKVVIYIIFLITLSTTSTKILEQNNRYLLKINEIHVAGLSNSKNLEIENDLSSIFYQNIFFISKKKINNIINKHNIIEKYTIKKIYPSKLNIQIKPTKLIAKVTDGNEFIIGSNGKLITIEKSDKILPYIFGEFNTKQFLEFQKNVEKSKFNFSEFKTVYFFPSRRWDILTINDI